MTRPWSYDEWFLISMAQAVYVYDCDAGRGTCTVTRQEVTRVIFPVVFSGEGW